MAKTRSQKQADVAELVTALKGAKSVMFADYQGMTVPKVTALRKEMSNAKVGYMVAKKTLLTIAAKEAGYNVNFRDFPGMLGIAMATEDEMAGAKIVGNAGKDGSIKLVGGIFDGNIVDAAYAITLSKLPSKSELLGQLLRVMNGPTSALARLLNAYKEKLEAGVPTPAPAAPVAEAAPEAPAPVEPPAVAPEAAPAV